MDSWTLIWCWIPFTVEQIENQIHDHIPLLSCTTQCNQNLVSPRGTKRVRVQWLSQPPSRLIRGGRECRWGGPPRVRNSLGTKLQCALQLSSWEPFVSTLQQLLLLHAAQPALLNLAQSLSVACHGTLHRAPRCSPPPEAGRSHRQSSAAAVPASRGGRTRPALAATARPTHPTAHTKIRPKGASVPIRWHPPSSKAIRLQTPPALSLLFAAAIIIITPSELCSDDISIISTHIPMQAHYIHIYLLHWSL